MSFRVVHLGRQPKPKDLIGRTLYALGDLMRALGTGLDAVGEAVQGPFAKHDARERSAVALGGSDCWSPANGRLWQRLRGLCKRQQGSSSGAGADALQPCPRALQWFPTPPACRLSPTRTSSSRPARRGR